MRKVIKGIQFTQVITHKKGEFQETVQHWILKKPRPIEECGVWLDGKQVVAFTDEDSEDAEEVVE